MTEARKEVAIALKHHRTTRKLTNEHQQVQLHQRHQPMSFRPSFYLCFSPDEIFKTRRRPRMYPPFSNKISHYLNDFSFSSPFPPFLTLPFPRPPLHLPPFPTPPILNFYLNTIISPFAQPPPKKEAPNFTLPSQTLGFNLNLYRFNSSKPTLLLNNNTLDPILFLNNNTLDSTFLLDNNTLDPTFLINNNILESTHMLNNNALDPTLVLDNNILDHTPLLNNNNNILEPTL